MMDRVGYWYTYTNVQIKVISRNHADTVCTLFKIQRYVITKIWGIKVQGKGQNGPVLPESATKSSDIKKLLNN